MRLAVAGQARLLGGGKFVCCILQGKQATTELVEKVMGVKYRGESSNRVGERRAGKWNRTEGLREGHKREGE